jgi:hypothetical protein
MNEDSYEDYRFMGYNFVDFGGNPTFRRNMSHPFSGQKCKVNKETSRNRQQVELFLLIYLKNGGDIFLRNVGISPNYAALQRI